MILERRYRIELEAIEPLRIGAVDDPRSGIHNPVAKVGDRVVIPGPSLKGALRAEVEQFLIDAYYDNKSQTWKRDKAAFQPCIPATKLTTDEQELIALGKYAKACHYPCQFDKRTERGYTKFTGECTTNGEPNPHSICPACYFLGAMGLSGFVRVPFLYAEISPEELYSARINRMSSTVVEGTNRPYQLTPVGTKFSGNLVIIFKTRLPDGELASRDRSKIRLSVINGWRTGVLKLRNW